MRFAARHLAAAWIVLSVTHADQAKAAVTPSDIDRCVRAQLERFGAALPARSDDALFLRRVCLDVTGRLPDPDQIRRFLASADDAKRSAVINTLVGSPEQADLLTMQWYDLLRVKSEFPANLWPNAVQAYARWLRESIGAYRPYDAIVRDMLTATGSNFRDPPVNFYRALPRKDATNIAAFISQSLMGVRFTTFSADQQRELANVFSCVDYKATTEWKEEIVFHNPSLWGEQSQTLRFPDGTTLRCAPGCDPRPLFAAWLTAPQNAFFSPAMANRVWSRLMGRGIVHEADDWRPDNPPANPELLGLLATAFRESGYDIRALYRLILNTQTYQAVALAPPDRLAARVDYAYYQVRQLDAETLIDIICQITGSTESYASPVPEPYTLFSESHAVRITDGSVTSPFLELFGRPPRDTGLLSERSNVPTTAQRLHLLNASHIQDKLLHAPVFTQLRRDRNESPAAANPIDELYLLALSRLPTQEERRTVSAYAAAHASSNLSVAQDLLWALINTRAFSVRR